VAPVSLAFSLVEISLLAPPLAHQEADQDFRKSCTAPVLPLCPDCSCLLGHPDEKYTPSACCLLCNLLSLSQSVIHYLLNIDAIVELRTLYREAI
jgi:hypothetical protein